MAASPAQSSMVHDPADPAKPPDPRAGGCENALFARYRTAGDAQALASLFDLVAPEFARVARYLAPRADLVDDALQATFLAAIEHADRWDERQPVVPWLLGILVNQIRHLRQQLRQPDEQRLPRPRCDAEADPFGASTRRELDARVRAAVALVRSPYREVLELHLLHDLAPHEIAARLELKPSAARMRLQRGLEHLRLLLLGLGGSASAAVPSPAVRERILVAAHDARVLPPAAAGAGKLLALALGLTTLLAAVWLILPRGERGLAATEATDTRTAAAVVAAPPRDAAPSAAEAVRTLAPPTSGRIRARVRRADTRAPLPSASVAIEDRLETTVFVDEAGCAELLASPGAVRLVAHLPGRARGVLGEVHVVAGGAVSLDLDIPVLAETLVRVVDRDGEGLAGAEVFALSLVERPRRGEPVQATLGRTDQHGELRFAAVESVDLLAVAPDHAPTPIERAAGPAVTLYATKPGRRVAGRVVDRHGRPVPHLPVAVQVSVALPEVPPLWLTTDADGQFVSSSAPHGAGFVCALQLAEHDGVWCASVLARGELQPGAAAEQIAMQVTPPATLVGRVGGSGGRNHVRLRLWPDDPRGSGLLARLLQRDAAASTDGEFRIGGLFPGTWHLSAAEGLDRHTRSTLALTAGATTRWDAVLPSNVLVRLRILGADGAPLRNEVTVYDHDGVGHFARLCADGVFEALVPYGLACNVVVHGRSPSITVACFDGVPVTEDVQLLQIGDAQRPGQVQGSFASLEPLGAERIQVQLLDPRPWVPRWAHTAKLDRTGHFRWALVPPGTYRLGVAGLADTDVHGMPESITVLAGETVALPPLELRPQSALVLRCAPAVEDGWLCLANGDAYERVSATAVEDRVELRALVAGTKHVLLWGAATAPCFAAVTVPAGDVGALRLRLVAAPPRTLRDAKLREGATVVLRDPEQRVVARLRLPPQASDELCRGLPSGWSLAVE